MLADFDNAADLAVVSENSSDESLEARTVRD
jgi:hypothetical protein